MIRRTIHRAERIARRLGRTRRAPVAGGDYRVVSPFVDLPLAAAWEPWMDAVYAAALSLGPGAVVDVGVNRMQTLFKVLSLDPARRYVGFEPQLPAAICARAFAEANRLDGVTIVAAGLSDAPGLLPLKLRSPLGFDGAASIADDRPDGFYRASVPIPLLQGDAALAALGLDAVRLINVDVEGAELEVLRGLSAALARGPIVTFEVLSLWRDPAGRPEEEALAALRRARAAAVADLLHAAGMQLFHVRADGLAPLDALDVEVGDDLGLCNYAAAPHAEAGAFAAAVAAQVRVRGGPAPSPSG